MQKPIFLRKRNVDPNYWFCWQGLGNPDIISNADGTFYIYGSGDEDFTELRRGDAIFFVERKIMGRYDVENGCTGTIGSVLAFLEDSYSPPYWPKVGGLGQGMAVVYSSEPDGCGHKYFGIVHVWDKRDREIENLPDDSIEKYEDNRAFLAWAASVDGINWVFFDDTNIGSINPCEDWAETDPKNAFPFLHRDCFQMTGYDQSEPWGREVFHHISAFYSDPTKHDRYGNQGDGYIYLIFGYTPQAYSGIWNLMARVKLDLNTYFGLGEVQLFKNDLDGLYCPIEGNWQTIGRCTGTHQGCSSISTTCERGPFSRPDDACIPCNLDVE